MAVLVRTVRVVDRCAPCARKAQRVLAASVLAWLGLFGASSLSAQEAAPDAPPQHAPTAAPTPASAPSVASLRDIVPPDASFVLRVAGFGDGPAAAEFAAVRSALAKPTFMSAFAAALGRDLGAADGFGLQRELEYWRTRLLGSKSWWHLVAREFALVGRVEPPGRPRLVGGLPRTVGRGA